MLATLYNLEILRQIPDDSYSQLVRWDTLSQTSIPYHSFHYPPSLQYSCFSPPPPFNAMKLRHLLLLPGSSRRADRTRELNIVLIYCHLFDTDSSLVRSPQSRDPCTNISIATFKYTDSYIINLRCNNCNCYVSWN